MLVGGDTGDGSRIVVDLDDVPVDDAIRATGHEPNGYFWQGVAEFLCADISPHLEFDPEGSLFAVSGQLALLEQLARTLEPVFNDTARALEVINAAEAAGFEFDD